MPDLPLKKQLDEIYTKTRQAITNIDALHNWKDNDIVRKKQQQLINMAPQKAQPRASFQAVKDTEKGNNKTNAHQTSPDLRKVL